MTMREDTGKVCIVSSPDSPVGVNLLVGGRNSEEKSPDSLEFASPFLWLLFSRLEENRRMMVVVVVVTMLYLP